MNIFVTVLTLAAVFASTEAGPQGRITHGQVAGEREFPFYVGIFNDGRLRCGGALISNNWVITAAHCVINMTVVDLLFGSTYANSVELNHTISGNNIYMHPGFNYSIRNNDIGLINTPYIEYTSKINPVLLPTMRDESELAGLLVTAMGWGRDQNGHRDFHLKSTIMRVMSREECEPELRISRTLRTSSQTTLCAMTYMGSTCYGDSGGPAVVSGKMEMRNVSILVGVVSFASHGNCPRTNTIGFARVTAFLDWISTVSGVNRP